MHKRSAIHSVTRHGETSSTDKATVDSYKKESSNFMNAEGYFTQQVFNCDEIGVFWNKMMNSTSVQKEKALQGQKPMKDRWTLLLSVKANTDMKIKRLIV